MTDPGSQDPLAHQAVERPQAIALQAPDRTWTYAQLDDEAEALARHLMATGLEPGATVATLLPEGPQAIATYHALTRAGLAIAPVHPGWTETEQVDHLDTLRPQLVVCNAETERQAALVTQAPPLVTLDGPGGTRAMPVFELPEAKQAPPGPQEDRPHAIIATSGTTGQPAGAVLSFRGLRLVAEASRARLSLTPEDAWLHTLSMAHVGGLATALRTVVTGSRLVWDGPFEASRFERLAEQARITHASLVPTMLHRWLDARITDAPAPEALGCLLVGGAACPRPLLQRALEAGAPVALTYGMTEASSQIATAPPELVARKPGTVGPPLEPVELRIQAPDEAGRGEIHVRGPTLALGYRGDRQLELEEGWLPTGDLGRLDEDGHLWITGRKSQRIVTGGVTVDPREVEEVLLDHVDIREACVVGVEDAEWGQRVSAAVVLYEDAHADAEALQAHCRERLSGPKLPRAFAVVSQLPRNANGKVDRAAVAALF